MNAETEDFCEPLGVVTWLIFDGKYVSQYTGQMDPSKIHPSWIGSIEYGSLRCHDLFLLVFRSFPPKKNRVIQWFHDSSFKIFKSPEVHDAYSWTLIYAPDWKLYKHEWHKIYD